MSRTGGRFAHSPGAVSLSCATLPLPREQALRVFLSTTVVEPSSGSAFPEASAVSSKGAKQVVISEATCHEKAVSSKASTRFPLPRAQVYLMENDSKQ